MSQDSRKNFGVKTQISIGAGERLGGGGDRRKEKTERVCRESDKVEIE